MLPGMSLPQKMLRKKLSFRALSVFWVYFSYSMKPRHSCIQQVKSYLISPVCSLLVSFIFPGCGIIALPWELILVILVQ